MEKPVAAAPGPVEHEAPNAIRMRERELLCDRAPHRRAHDVGPVEPEGVHQGGRVGREVGDGERPGGRR